MGDDRASAYWEGDLLVFRCSAFGKCKRDLIAHLLGHEPKAPPEKVQGYFDQGNLSEPIILDRLESMGWKMAGRGQEEGELRIGSNAVIRFHPDEITVANAIPGERVLEIKGFADSTFRTAREKGIGKVFPEYEWQMSVMMHAYKLPGVWVAGKKHVHDETEELSITELEIQWVEKAPISMGQIVKRVKEIREYVERGELPDCEDLNQWPCPFFYMRPEAEPIEATLDGDAAEELDRLAAAYDEARAAEKEAKDAKKVARDELVALLAGRDEESTDQWRVFWQKSDRTTFNRAAAEAELGEDVIAAFDETEEQSTFQVKAVS